MPLVIAWYSYCCVFFTNNVVKASEQLPIHPEVVSWLCWETGTKGSTMAAFTQHKVTQCISGSFVYVMGLVDLGSDCIVTLD